MTANSEIFKQKDVLLGTEQQLLSVLHTDETYIDNDFHNLMDEDNNLFFVDKSLAEINLAVLEYWYSELHYGEITPKDIHEVITVYAFNDNYVAIWTD